MVNKQEELENESKGGLPSIERSSIQSMSEPEFLRAIRKNVENNTGLSARKIESESKSMGLNQDRNKSQRKTTSQTRIEPKNDSDTVRRVVSQLNYGKKLNLEQRLHGDSHKTRIDAIGGVANVNRDIHEILSSRRGSSGNVAKPLTKSNIPNQTQQRFNKLSLKI